MGRSLQNLETLKDLKRITERSICALPATAACYPIRFYYKEFIIGGDAFSCLKEDLIVFASIVFGTPLAAAIIYLFFPVPLKKNTIRNIFFCTYTLHFKVL